MPSHEGSSYVVADLASPLPKGSTPEAGGISSVITKAYEILGLISFFTTGEDETRAWTIIKGIRRRNIA